MAFSDSESAHSAYSLAQRCQLNQISDKNINNEHYADMNSDIDGHLRLPRRSESTLPVQGTISDSDTRESRVKKRQRLPRDQMQRKLVIASTASPGKV